MTGYRARYHPRYQPGYQGGNSESGQRREQTGAEPVTTPIPRGVTPPEVTVSSSADHQLLTRIRGHEDDAEELAETVSTIIAAARATGLAQAVLTRLHATARVLATTAIMPVPAPRPGGPRRYVTSEAFLDAISEAEDQITEAVRTAARTHPEASAALASAHAALAHACTMAAATPGQLTGRRAAIDAATKRIATCKAALDALAELRDRYREALRLLRQVPGDLGWVYAAIYDIQRQGHDLPDEAREWFGVSEVTA